MIFFVLHHLFQILPISDLRRNCLTFLLGTVSYFILRGYLESHQTNWLFKTIVNWFWYLVAADVITMGIIYREYYGRSLVQEAFTDPDKWNWDPKQHKYQRTELSEQQEYFRDKLDTLDQVDQKNQQVDQSLQQLAKSKEKLDKIDQIEENLNELDLAFKYRPEGEEVQALKEHFTQLADDQTT